MATIDEVRKILAQFRLDALHDYTDEGTYISNLGIYEEPLADLKEWIGEGWDFVLRRYIDETGWCRVDIVPKGK